MQGLISLDLDVLLHIAMFSTVKSVFRLKLVSREFNDIISADRGQNRDTVFAAVDRIEHPMLKLSDITSCSIMQIRMFGCTVATYGTMCTRNGSYHYMFTRVHTEIYGDDSQMDTISSELEHINTCRGGRGYVSFTSDIKTECDYNAAIVRLCPSLAELLRITT